MVGLSSMVPRNSTGSVDTGEAKAAKTPRSLLVEAATADCRGGSRLYETGDT